MPIKLYSLEASPPVRAVWMICEIYNIPLELIDIELRTGDHLKPEFLKINPLHTVPAMDDDGTILHDSHAILIYLSEMYGKDKSLYPKDPKGRALVNQKLFFNNAYLFPRMRNVTTPIFMGGRGVQQQHLESIKEVYDFMETFLEKTKYLAGDNITIADIAAFPSVCGLMYIVPIDSARYPKITAWIKYFESQPYSKKHNEKGAKMLGEIVQNGMK
uniref:Glutathione S-transferase 1 n=1 Tax=Chilo suppressalis TaxID=168631 RepID=A0A0S3G4L2_CHISP|nr:glutathione S-transferase 1 [Chilo suppressalis]